MKHADPDLETQLAELHQRHADLRAVCQLWMAANDEKQARIDRLEQHVRRLTERVHRLKYRVVNRPAKHARPQLSVTQRM